MRYRIAVIAVLTALILSACGGGGSFNGDPPDSADWFGDGP
jgi:hypothetical protein